MINGKNFIAIPRITTAERLALPSYNGLLVYDTDLNALYKFENGAWSSFSGGGGIPDAPNDANAYVRSALSWVVGYTKSAIDTLLGNKQDKRIVVSSSQTAVIDEAYTLVATATFTDPTPVEGKGFSVLIRNGTATIGGTNYSTAGTTIWRVFHSGAWANYVNQLGLGFTAENSANKQTALSTNAAHYYNAPYINSLILYRSIDVTIYSASATTAETILGAKLIPSGTFANGDVVEVAFVVRRFNANGTIIPRLRQNTSNSLSGSNLLATGATMQTTDFYQGFRRLLTLRSDGFTQTLNNTSASASDFVNSTGVASNVSLNWAVDQWILPTAQPSNSGDLATITAIQIRKL
jgi:hypothetical protein